RAELTGGVGNNTLEATLFSGPVTLSGGGGNDLLLGGGSSDVLTGGPGDDRMRFGAGADGFDGGEGTDTIEATADVDWTLTSTVLTGTTTHSLVGIERAALGGGVSNNRIDASAFGGPVTLFGFAGNDTLIAAAANDSLNGGAGDDQLVGNGGDDTLVGGEGADRAEAAADVDFSLTPTTLTGQGTDSLIGVERARLSGLGGNNRIDASAFDGPVTLEGGTGADTLIGGEAGDALVGGDGDDQLIGNAGPDSMTGGAGSDSLRGSDIVGSDDAGNQLDGGTGNDTLRGGTGADALVGGDDDDSLFGSTGSDTLHGAAGNDVLDGFDGDDALDGGVGTDRLVATADASFLLTTFSLSGQGEDSVTGIEQAVLTGGGGHNNIRAFAFTGPVTLVGGAGNDTLSGGHGADSLNGGTGDDLISGGASGDFVVGGTGTDRVGVSLNTAGSIFLTTNTATSITAASTEVDGLSGIEGAVLSGGSGNDLLDATGFGGAVLINGQDGDDTLVGGAAGDTLQGGFGADVLNGGLGVNTYVPNPTPLNAHRALYLQFDGARIEYDIPNSTNDLVGWAGSDWEQNDALDLNHNGIDVSPFRENEVGREAAIKEVMRLVGADYRAFGVDVVRRNADELAVTGVRATTVFVGPSTIDQAVGLHGRAGDVDLGNDNKTDVAVARTEKGATNAEKIQFVANVIAHEAGHTFGLRHKTNVANGQALNELMVQGSSTTVAQFQTNNFTFLDRTFNLAHDPGTENSYRTLMQNMGFPNPPPGPLGTPLPAVPADAVDSDGELDFGRGPLGGGCGCALCGGAALAAAKADTAAREQSAEFLHRLRPAEFVTTGLMTPGVVIRPADLNRTGEGSYRVVRTVRAPDDPRRLAGVVLSAVAEPEASSVISNGAVADETALAL
ncbi:MAG TPA: hypothetical protein VM597_12885, partial [Gemmataceae bacterium]|nr:hypothetical protein [Gemmataceae bacterium]